MDQAVGLRKKWPERDVWSGTSQVDQMSLTDQAVRSLAVSSGKGGVGKSNIVVNLAMAFDQMGLKVLILDADLGLANVDVLLGLAPKYNIKHVLHGEKGIEEVLVQGPGEIKIMPASSGVQELTQLTTDQKMLFLELLDELETDLDVLLIDTGAGISDTVLYFNLAAQEKIVIVTPEPTSLTDAYALIKVLHTKHGERQFKILANAVRDEREGRAIFSKISRVADHFLDGLSLDYLGFIPVDDSIPLAVKNQRPLLDVFPSSPAALALKRIAKRIKKNPPAVNLGNVQFFWKRLLGV